MSSSSLSDVVVETKSKDSSSSNDEPAEGEVEKKDDASDVGGDAKNVRNCEAQGSGTQAKKRKYEEDADEAKIQNITSEQGTSTSTLPSDLSTGTSRDAAETTNNKPDHTKVVAQHYNALEEKGVGQRAQSKIFYMRNFNNWIKSTLINNFIEKIRQNSNSSSLKVLDMCCGKGGDLLKWKKGNITHLICADIADVSIEQCETRYKDMMKSNRNERGFPPLFSAEFIAADCTKVRLREKYRDPSIDIDLVSCQFSLHYSFETLPQAECMLQNASETLRAGGYLIGTIPDACDLVYIRLRISLKHEGLEEILLKFTGDFVNYPPLSLHTEISLNPLNLGEFMRRSRWKKIDGNKFGNEVYSVEFLCDKDNIPLFGAKYNFHLEGVVNCPEFLVYLPLLKKLALKYGLEFVMFERFDDFFDRMKNEKRSLLGNMQALETYPPYHEAPLLGQNPGDYLHAVQYMQNSTGHRKIGTLSLSEWEATSIYAVIAFQKMKVSWNSEGKPEYSKL